MWQAHGVRLDRRIRDAIERDELVIFAGAGVSSAKPAGLPDFKELAKQLAEDLGRPALTAAAEGSSFQFDVVMGQLNEVAGDVHTRVTDRLLQTIEPNDYHRDLLHWTRERGATPRIVTTNFDLLFETAAQRSGIELEVHTAPALPLGDDFNGLIHLHGVVQPQPHQRMVVTDDDFGRAYITEGWATQFLSRMFEKYTVVFIGYSANDTVMRYLTRALPKVDGRRFAFTRSDRPEENLRWDELGVIQISHPASEVEPYASLEAFCSALGNQLHAPAEVRYDAIDDAVRRGPAAFFEDENAHWTLTQVDLLGHFWSLAAPDEWIPRVHKEGLIQQLFVDNPDGDELTLARWAEWAARSLRSDDGENLQSAAADHNGRLGPLLWFNIWRMLIEGVLEGEHLRRWVVLLATDTPSRDPKRLSFLLDRLADRDPATAEFLLGALSSLRLTSARRRGWPSRSSTVAVEYKPLWDIHSVGKAWEKLRGHLNDPATMLALLKSRILEIEAADMAAQGTPSERSVTARRRRVALDERFGRDEPAALLVSMARDLLRRQVHALGLGAALEWLRNSSHMIRRVALDSITVVDEEQADEALQLFLEEIPLFEHRSRFEVVDALRAIYPKCTFENRRKLVDHVQSDLSSDDPIDPPHVRARMNLIHWLCEDATDEDDPARVAFAELESRFPGIRVTDHPDADSRISIGSGREEDEVDETRFVEMSAKQLVEALSSDPRFDDYRDQTSLFTELEAALVAQPALTLRLLDECIARAYWNVSLWVFLIRQLIKPDRAWSAVDLIRRIVARPSDAGSLGGGLTYEITDPDSVPDEELPPLADERLKLILELWERSPIEHSSDGEVDVMDAAMSERGTLARGVVKLVLRRAYAAEPRGVDEVGARALSRLLAAADRNGEDVSAMQLARDLGHLSLLAPDWFDSEVGARLKSIEETSVSIAWWSGVVSGFLFPEDLRDVRNSIRLGWPVFSRGAHKLKQQFIDLHAFFFTETDPTDSPAWADPFIATATDEDRVAWLAAVHDEYQRQESPDHAGLLAYWERRVQGMPPLTGAEQTALLRWFDLPGMNIERATALFVAGPQIEDAFSVRRVDYIDLDDFPEGYAASYFQIVEVLLRKARTVPYSIPKIVKALVAATDLDEELRTAIWRHLLRIGVSEARAHLPARI